MTTDFIKRGYVRYGLAVAGAGAGFFLRLALERWAGAGLPTYITFYPMVMLVALLCGVWPGIVATMAVALIADYWIIPPVGSFQIATLHDAVGLAFFIGMGVFMSVVGGLYRRIRSNLEAMVADRTRELSVANAALKRHVELIDAARADLVVQEMQRILREHDMRAAAPSPDDHSFRYVPLMAGTLVTGVGLLVLAGWTFDLVQLKSVCFGLVSMKANTALCFVLAGLALCLRERKVWRMIFAGAVCLIGVLTLVEYATGIYTGLDQLLCHDPGDLQTAYPGRMAFVSAISFTAISTALLMLKARAKAALLVQQVLTVCVGIAGMVAVIGYLYKDQGLYSFGATTSVALFTAVAFMVLAVGLVFARTDGLGGVLMGSSPGAQLARRLLPAVLLAPPILGRLTDYGVYHGWYSDPTGTAFFALLMMLSLALLILWTASVLTRADAARRETEAQLRNQAELMDQATDALIVRESTGPIRFWNRGAEALFGWPATEAIGQRIHVLLQTEGLPPNHEAQLQQTGHWEGELEHTTRDGRRVIVECRKTAIRTDTGQILILESNRDVTERRKAELSAARLHGELEKYASDLKQTNKTLEESRHAALNLMEDSVIERARAEQINAELRESQERLKRAQEIAHLGSWELDLVKNRLTWSDELYRILGLKPQAVQASREAFLARVHPDDRAAVDAAYSSSLRENRDTYESEHRIVREDTGEIRMVYERSQHFHDANGRIFRSIGMVHDITERKLAEQALARTAKELGRSNKDLEQFAHVTSHDLKEPLRMVTGFMSLLKERYSGKLDAKAGEYIDFAADAAGRMQKMVDDLLAYARAGRDDVVEQADAGTAVDAALRNLRISIEESGAVITRDPLPAIRTSALGLTQVFQNLIGNAIKFRKTGTKPEIHVGAEKVMGHQSLAISHSSLETEVQSPMTNDLSPYWLFSVRDNGIGMDPQFADRIFKIFQRLHTREEYPGSGVGLAICKKIVEQHGGKIWMESKPGAGSVFYFTLPDIEEEA